MKVEMSGVYPAFSYYRPKCGDTIQEKQFLVLHVITKVKGHVLDILVSSEKRIDELED